VELLAAPEKGTHLKGLCHIPKPWLLVIDRAFFDPGNKANLLGVEVRNARGEQGADCLVRGWRLLEVRDPRCNRRLPALTTKLNAAKKPAVPAKQLTH